MNYWQFKFKEVLWEGFEKLEIGDVFNTTVREIHKLSNRIGDIVFWYKQDNNKGIYFVSEIISEPRENEESNTGYSIDLRILKSLVKEPFILEENGFTNLVTKINKKQQGGSKYLFKEEDRGNELYNLLSVEDVKKQSNIKINKQLIEDIEKLKDKNIEEGIMFNPFLDMNLIKGEVKHISFIANLLNPNGTHYERDLFLKTFLSYFIKNNSDNKNLKNLKNFNTKDANVIIEKLTDTKKRIDLWIEDENTIIAIEGKIESIDSFNQLNNYNNYLKNQKKQYILIYLTKEGDEPTNDYPSDVILMSFKNDIMEIIKNSLDKVKHPKVKTTLIEYHNALLTYIYGLESTWKYSYDILNAITKNSDNFKNYRDIKNYFYYDKNKYSLSVVEDIAENFEKSKAKIELEIFKRIKLTIETELKNLTFNENSAYTNVLKNLDSEIELMKDIVTTYKARRERIFIKNYDFVQIAYKVNQYEILICSDIDGLNVYKILGGQTIDEQNIFEDEFSNQKISELIFEKNIKRVVSNVLNAIQKLTN